MKEKELYKDFGIPNLNLVVGLVLKADIKTIEQIFNLVTDSNGFIIFKKVVSPDKKLYICDEKGEAV